MHIGHHIASAGARGHVLAVGLLAASLTGCIANSSNPLVVIRSATLTEQNASFTLELQNPGGRDLTVTRLEYDVSHGEAAFPVAKGAWTGNVDLPAQGRAMLTLPVTLDTPPIEADSRRLQLAGEMFFEDRTGFLGLKFMDLTRTPFRGDVQAEGGAR